MPEKDCITLAKGDDAANLLSTRQVSRLGCSLYMSRCAISDFAYAFPHSNFEALTKSAGKFTRKVDQECDRGGDVTIGTTIQHSGITLGLYVCSNTSGPGDVSAVVTDRALAVKVSSQVQAYETCDGARYFAVPAELAEAVFALAEG